jgi:hypothetical protein
VTRIDIDGESYACPFAGLLRPHTPGERAAMRESILADGVTSPVITYLSDLHGRAVIDGMNRPLYVAELAADGHEVEPPPVLCLGRLDDKTAKRLALSLNLARRQLTIEEQQVARGERIKRIAAANLSTRELAALEGVSQTQIVEDKRVARLAGSEHQCSRKRTTRPLPVRTYRGAQSLESKVKAILAHKAYAVRLAAVASSHGCPLDGKRWPALELVAAVLRDVAG